MYRVSSSMHTLNIQKDMMRLEGKIYESNNSISSGISFSRPSENPISFLSSLRLRSSLSQISLYKDNANFAKENLDFIDSNIQHMTNALQRLRELIIQAVNGTLEEKDRENVRREVLQLTSQIAATANEQYNGRYLFSGFETLRPPFVITEIEGEIQAINYVGDSGEMTADIGNSNKVAFSLPASKLFYSENQTIIPEKNLANFIATEDSTIKINNTQINIYKGDTIDVIIERINKANTGVKANFDINTSEFYFETTYPHQPFFEDIKGNLLEKMGILDPIGKPPANLSRNVRKFGGSLFDQLINFSKALKSNDIESLSTRTLALIDNSINNLIKYQAEIGSRSEKALLASNQYENLSLILQDQLSNNLETDVTKTITDLKAYELMHQAALQIGSKIYDLTLLNFIR
ncbi:MAG: flagellar hook-associated protein FlgL [Spirochaetales bacterium]|nr:flagellar hook-associated protein FlgL [Spirochaetales bacterium]